MIAHTRTRNWLHKAEQLRNNGEHEGSIEASAVAFAVFRAAHAPARRSRSIESVLKQNRQRSRNDSANYPDLSEVVQAIDEQIGDLQKRMDILSAGLSADAYQRFEDLVPTIHLSVARTIQVGRKWQGASVDYESALFCSSFVVDAALH